MGKSTFTLRTGGLLTVTSLVRRCFPRIRYVAYCTSVVGVGPGSSRSLRGLEHTKFGRLCVNLRATCSPTLSRVEGNCARGSRCRRLREVRGTKVRCGTLLVLNITKENGCVRGTRTAVGLLGAFGPGVMNPLAASVRGPTPLCSVGVGNRFIRSARQRVVLRRLVLLRGLRVSSSYFFFKDRPCGLVEFDGAFGGEGGVISSLGGRISGVSRLEPKVLSAIFPENGLWGRCGVVYLVVKDLLFGSGRCCVRSFVGLDSFLDLIVGLGSSSGSK